MNSTEFIEENFKKHPKIKNQLLKFNNEQEIKLYDLRYFYFIFKNDFKNISKYKLVYSQFNTFQEIFSLYKNISSFKFHQFYFYSKEDIYKFSKDNDISYSEEEGLIILEFDSYHKIKQTGISEWCIVRSHSQFKSYTEDGNRQFVLIYNDGDHSHCAGLTTDQSFNEVVHFQTSNEHIGFVFPFYKFISYLKKYHFDLSSRVSYYFNDSSFKFLREDGFYNTSSSCSKNESYLLINNGDRIVITKKRKSSGDWKGNWRIEFPNRNTSKIMSIANIENEFSEEILKYTKFSEFIKEARLDLLDEKISNVFDKILIIVVILGLASSYFYYLKSLTNSTFAIIFSIMVTGIFVIPIKEITFYKTKMKKTFNASVFLSIALFIVFGPIVYKLLFL